MKKIGIIGVGGFIGNHLNNTIKLLCDEYMIIPFKKSMFENEIQLDSFVRSCDVIIHLAGLNRDPEPYVIYQTNINLTQKIIDSLHRTNTKPHVLISSSTQENSDNLYGLSKKKCRELLSEWSKYTGANFTGLIIPNVFGPFCKPNYNSVIATFSHQLCNDIEPKVDNDSLIKLIYINELIEIILKLIKTGDNTHFYVIDNCIEYRVSNLLTLLNNYKKTYLLNGEIPSLNNNFELNMFNTFRSYINYNQFFPKKYIVNPDDRGLFVEITRSGISGQSSFSTTNPNVTRGNHYHTRKIERFAVIKGKAKIQMRRIGTDEIITYYLDGEVPSYVDIPVWYIHNITNVGDNLLYTCFWINEPYDSNNSDTYFEIV